MSTLNAETISLITEKLVEQLSVIENRLELEHALRFCNNFLVKLTGEEFKCTDDQVKEWKKIFKQFVNDKDVKVTFKKGEFCVSYHVSTGYADWHNEDKFTPWMFHTYLKIKKLV